MSKAASRCLQGRCTCNASRLTDLDPTEHLQDVVEQIKSVKQLCDAFTAIMQNSGVQLRGGTKTLFKRSWNLWARRLMRITAAKCKSRQGHHGQVHSLFTAAWLTWECMQCAHEHLNYWSRWIKVIILHGSVTGWITFALEIAVFSLGWRRLCQRLILVSRLIWTKSSRIS